MGGPPSLRSLTRQLTSATRTSLLAASPGGQPPAAEKTFQKCEESVGSRLRLGGLGHLWRGRGGGVLV